MPNAEQGDDVSERAGGYAVMPEPVLVTGAVVGSAVLALGGSARPADGRGGPASAADHRVLALLRDIPDDPTFAAALDLLAADPADQDVIGYLRTLVGQRVGPVLARRGPAGTPWREVVRQAWSARHPADPLRWLGPPPGSAGSSGGPPAK